MPEIVPIEIGKSKKNDPLESSRTKRILDYLNAIPGCKAAKRHQSGWNNKGDADIFGCIKGKHFELEVKKPTKKLTLLQLTKIKEWDLVGAITGRVEGIDDVRMIFRKHGYDI